MVAKQRKRPITSGVPQMLTNLVLRDGRSILPRPFCLWNGLLIAPASLRTDDDFVRSYNMIYLYFQTGPLETALFMMQVIMVPCHPSSEEAFRGYLASLANSHTSS